MSEGKKEAFLMFEYVKWCSSVEESARGRYNDVKSRICRYSEIKSSNISDFLQVNSRVFKTTHFLTNSPVIFMEAQIFIYVPQFPPYLKNMGFLEAIV